MQRSQLRASESENQATRWSPTRTLKTYVRLRRLARALDALAHTDERILEIARYRKSHQSIPFLRNVRFDEDYLCHLHGGVSLEPDVSVQPARFMVGLSTRFFYSSWLARSGLRHTCGPDIEVYGPGYHQESANSEVLYAIPVAPGA